MIRKSAQFVISTLAHLRRPFFFWMSLLSLALIGISAGYLWYYLFPEATEQLFVPLHYNVHSGVDTIGEAPYLFLAPAIALCIFIVNALLSTAFYKKDPLVSYASSVTSAFCSLLALLSIIHLVAVNLAYYG